MVSSSSRPPNPHRGPGPGYPCSQSARESAKTFHTEIATHAMFQTKTNQPEPAPTQPLGSTTQRVLMLSTEGDDYERTFDQFTDQSVRDNTVIVGQTTVVSWGRPGTASPWHAVPRNQPHRPSDPACHCPVQ